MSNFCNNPKVSVCVITYNQERYIGKCLQSIIDQETSFAFEVIVGDDCSTDSTPDIIKNFSKLYPGIIKPVFQKANINHGCNNYRITHMKAVGEYIAHMDGDDVMLPGKLQAQCDFLDNNPQCSMVVHRADIIIGDKIFKSEHSKVSHPKYSDIYRLLKLHNFFTHSSKMYRKCASPEKSCINHQFFIDFFIHLEHVCWGPIGFIDETLVLYRKLPHSHSQSKGKSLYRLIDHTLKGYKMAESLTFDNDLVKRYSSIYAFKSAFFCLKRGDSIGFRRYINISSSYSLSRTSLFYRFISGFSNYPNLQIALAKSILFLLPIFKFVYNRVLNHSIFLSRINQ